MKFELGETIAERSLIAKQEDGSEFVIRVVLGTPGILLDSTDVYAPYQIDYGNKKRLWRAVGIDGFQALNLAMKMLVVEIEALETTYQIRVLSNRDKEGNLGFNNF